MSQEKVDRYKKEKANRKQIMKKQKIMHNLRVTVAAAVVCAVVAWVGVSMYQSHEANQPRESVEVDYSAVDSYMNGVSE